MVSGHPFLNTFSSFKYAAITLSVLTVALVLLRFFMKIDILPPEYFLNMFYIYPFMILIGCIYFLVAHFQLAKHREGGKISFFRTLLHMLSFARTSEKNDDDARDQFLYGIYKDIFIFLVSLMLFFVVGAKMFLKLSQKYNTTLKYQLEKAKLSPLIASDVVGNLRKRRKQMRPIYYDD